MDTALVNYAAAAIVGIIIGAALNSRTVQALYYDHAYSGVTRPYAGNIDDYEHPPRDSPSAVWACATPMSAAEKLKAP